MKITTEDGVFVVDGYGSIMLHNNNTGAPLLELGDINSPMPITIRNIHGIGYRNRKEAIVHLLNHFKYGKFTKWIIKLFL